jgi:hypothetical protein
LPLSEKKGDELKMRCWVEVAFDDGDVQDIKAQRHNTPQKRAPILHTLCSFVEILYVQNNLACYGLGMRQPAHGCNVRAKRLTHFILTFLS